MPYLGPGIDNGYRSRFIYTATAGQTSFSGGDDNGITLTYTDSEYLDVYQNGVLLVPGDDYAATTGTTVVLVQGASLNDKVEMIQYQAFGVADTVSRADGGAFGGNISTSGTLTVTGTTTLTGGILNGVTINGTTPTLTIGDGGAEDTAIIFDGNAQDFYIGLDDTNDNLSIGLGTTIGGTQLIKMTSGDIVINEDSANIDFRIESDSDANMFHLDAGENKIKIGTGASNSGYISIRSTIDDGQSRAIYAENYQDGNPSANDVVMISAQYSNFTGTMLRIHHEVENANQLMIKVDTTGSNTVKFSVDEDGDVQSASNSYGSTSDERIKQDIVDANSQWDDIKAIKIRNYKRKTVSNPKTEIGVIAQELETAGMNGLVKESDPSVADIEVDSSFGTIVDDDSVSPNPDGSKKRKVGEVKAQVKEVKYSVLYMKAIKALQEAMTRIETLEAKVKVLEG